MCQPLFEFAPFFLHLLELHLVQVLQLWGRFLNSGSSFSGLGTSHLFPDAPWFWVVCWSTLALFLAPVSLCSLKQDSPVCLVAAAVVARHPWVVSSGQARGVESLSYEVIFPSLRNHSVNVLKPIGVREFVPSSFLKCFSQFLLEPSNSNEQRRSNVFPLKFLWPRMSFHFLSSIKTTSSEWLYTGFVRIFNCFAWVSSMPSDGSVFVEPGSLFFAKHLSDPTCSSNSELAGLWSGSLRRISSTWRFFYLGISPHPGFSIFCCGKNLNFNSAGVKTSCNMNLKNWSKLCFSRRSVFLCMLEFGLQNHRNSSHECCIFTKLSHIGFLSQVFQISEVVLAICLEMPHCRILEFCTKEFASCGFTFFSSCSFTLATDFSTVDSLWFGVHWANSSHQLDTAPLILSWFAEWIVRHNSSVFDESALKCMVHLPLFFSEFHDSQHWCPWTLGDQFLWNVPHLCGDGISFWFRCVVDSSVPFFFITWAYEWPVSSREPPRVIRDLFETPNASFWISSLRPIDVIEHWHEGDPSFYMFRLNVLILQVFLDLLEDLQRGKSWEIFHSNSNRFSVNSK